MQKADSLACTSGMGTGAAQPSSVCRWCWVVEVVGLVCVLCCAVLSESGQIAEGVCHWSLQCLGIDRLTGDRAYVRTAERQTIIRCVCEGVGGVEEWCDCKWKGWCWGGDGEETWEWGCSWSSLSLTLGVWSALIHRHGSPLPQGGGHSRGPHPPSFLYSLSLSLSLSLSFFSLFSLTLFSLSLLTLT